MPRLRKRARARMKRKKRAAKEFGLEIPEDKRQQVSGVLQMALGVILLIVFRGQGGRLGNAVSDLFAQLLGKGSLVLPIVLIISGALSLKGSNGNLPARRRLGFALLLLGVVGWLQMQAPLGRIYLDRESLGGFLGFLVAFPLLFFTSRAVGYVVLSSLLAVGFILSFDVHVVSLLRRVGSSVRGAREEKTARGERAKSDEEAKEAKDAEEIVSRGTEGALREEELNIVRPAFMEDQKPKGGKAFTQKKVSKGDDDGIKMSDKRFADWEFPPLDLLSDDRSTVTIDDETLKAQARRIEQKLREFGVTVTVKDAHPGPTVTQFTLEPSEGIKLSRIGTLKDDLALALAAPSLRMESPIPGKSLVGIEIPNPERTIVHLREIIESAEFRESTDPLTIPIGRDVSGAPIIGDLEQMPHLLIAGATGSGKSVCINSVLLSFLYQNAPHELKFILIDPKRVELMPYDGIPHLLHPVITDSEKALQALRWAVAEMQRRYHKLSDAKVRNIAEFNEKVEEDERMYRIVIVIDELADLMMRQWRRDTENVIARISQMARATGIHLIVSTQRPSVDVITGLIKANIPTRIAFRTVSSVDSRTIIDCIGAEELLGKGDMLYLTAEVPEVRRMQGIFVSTKEVEKVIRRVKIAGGGEITEEIPIAESEEEGETVLPGAITTGVIDLTADDDGGDPLTFEAIELVKATGKGSATHLQRRLRIGYARAARLLDILEQKGIVGPVDGAKPRKVFVE